MNPLSAAAIVGATGCLLGGAYVLGRSPRALTHRLFAVIAGLGAYWALCFAFFLGAPTKAEAWGWYLLSAPGWTLSPGFLLLFFLTLSRPRKRPLPALAWGVCLLPGVAFSLGHLHHPLFVADLVRCPLGWCEIISDGPLPWLYVAYYLGCAGTGFVLLARRAWRSPRRAHRLQARLIIGVGLTSLALATTVNRVLPLLVPGRVPSLAVLALVPWVLSFVVATARYQFLTINPEAAAQRILETMSDALLLLAPDRRVREANPAACELLGRARAELRGQPLASLLAEPDAVEALTGVSLAADGQVPGLDTAVRREGGEPVPVSVSASQVNDAWGDPVGVVLLLRDSSNQRRARQRLQHMATHDALTGLPNRVLLDDRLQQGLARAQRSGRKLAVLHLDLDHFKQVNDTLGHEVGDAVLREVAARLQAELRGEDTVARTGGDEFVILLSSVEQAAAAMATAQRLLESVSQPLSAGDTELTVTPSVGICLYPDDATLTRDLLRNSDLALYQAKDRGRGRVVLFEPSMRSQKEQGEALELELRRALERGELVLHYQPICDLGERTIVAVEALVRWQHAREGLVMPAEFLPVAERTGLMGPIGAWVLGDACAQLAAWDASGLPPLTLCVNLAASQVAIPGLVAQVIAALDEHGLAPARLQLEVGESTAMSRQPALRRNLDGLAAAGVRIALDDYGSEDTSLAPLQRSLITAVKLDRSLVRALGLTTAEGAVTRSLVALARDRGLEVVAEGIERPDELAAVVAPVPGGGAGCSQAQGYLIAEPMSAPRASSLFRRQLLNGRLRSPTVPPTGAGAEGDSAAADGPDPGSAEDAG